MKPLNRKPRTGAMLPIVAVTTIILFVAAALAIDIAHIHVVRSELRTATDAAARAAVETLGREQDIDAAREAAIRVAAENLVAGRGLTLSPDDIQFGGSTQNDDDSFSFDPNASFINSVQILGERVEGSPDGPVPMFFGPLFGTTNFQPTQSATATRLDRDIALVLDVSGSMGGSRFSGLTSAVDVFLAELDDSPQEERVSLTVYNSRARKLRRLTRNLPSIATGIRSQSPSGATAIGRGLRVGIDSVLNDPESRRFALKSVILMTDGNHNRGPRPETVAPDAAAQDVKIFTITFGRGADQNSMRRVAEIGNGEHFHADGNADLANVFQVIARQLRVILTE